jgi:hypothetical protein
LAQILFEIPRIFGHASSAEAVVCSHSDYYLLLIPKMRAVLLTQ